MIYGIDIQTKEKIKSEPHIKANCPLCNGLLIPKCGEIKVWHFAHKVKDECNKAKEIIANYLNVKKS